MRTTVTIDDHFKSQAGDISSPAARAISARRVMPVRGTGLRYLDGRAFNARGY